MDPNRAQWNDPTVQTSQYDENPQHVRNHTWRNTAIVGICVLVVVGVLAAASLWTTGGNSPVFNGKAKQSAGLDAGVSACHILADGFHDNTPDTPTNDASVPVLEAFATQFDRSQYDDIRKPGVEFVNALIPIAEAGDTDAAGVLALQSLGKLTTSFSALHDACTAHGVKGFPTAADLFDDDGTTHA